MVYCNHAALVPRCNCSRWLPDPEEAGRYAWPQCASLARAFARRGDDLHGSASDQS